MEDEAIVDDRLVNSPVSDVPTIRPIEPTHHATASDKHYWIKRVVYQTILKTAATLSLMITVLNVLLQWMQLLRTAKYTPYTLGEWVAHPDSDRWQK